MKVALELPDVFVTRTFSKAYGMAGMRMGYAPLLGMYGCSLLVALAAGLLAAMLHATRLQATGTPSKNYTKLLIIKGFLLACLYGGGAMLQQHEWTTALGEPLPVALVQGNVAQEMIHFVLSLPVIAGFLWVAGSLEPLSVRIVSLPRDRAPRAWSARPVPPARSRRTLLGRSLLWKELVRKSRLL